VPAKTNTETIRELEKAAVLVEEKLDGVRREVTRLDTAHAKTADTLAQLVTQVAILTEKVADLKKSQEESDRRRWTLWLAVIGCLLTLAANIVLSFWRK